MVEFWLSLDYVGYNRAFITGRTEDNDDFELELNEAQKDKLYAFNAAQEARVQEFLRELIR